MQSIALESQVVVPVRVPFQSVERRGTDKSNKESTRNSSRNIVGLESLPSANESQVDEHESKLDDVEKGGACGTSSRNNISFKVPSSTRLATAKVRTGLPSSGVPKHHVQLRLDHRHCMPTDSASTTVPSTVHSVH